MPTLLTSARPGESGETANEAFSEDDGCADYKRVYARLRRASLHMTSGKLPLTSTRLRGDEWSLTSLTSLHLDAGGANDPRPFVDFPFDPIGEFLGRAGDRLEAERGEALAYLRQRDNPGDLAMQTIDDLLRCAARYQHTQDDLGFLIGGARFRERRHVRQRGRPPRAGDRERAHRALLDVPGGGGNRSVEDRRMPADGRGDRGSTAVEGDSHEVEPERLLEHFAREVTRGPEASMGIAVLSRPRFHPGDELFDARCRNGRMHQQHARNHVHRPTRREWRHHLHRPIGVGRWLRPACCGDEQRGKPNHDRLQLCNLHAQSARMFASRTTLLHFAISALMRMPN